MKFCILSQSWNGQNNDNLVKCLMKGSRWSIFVRLDLLIQKYMYVWMKYCVQGDILKWRKNDHLVNCLFKRSILSNCVGLDELIPKIYIYVWVKYCKLSENQMGKILKIWWTALLRGIDYLDVLALMCWFQKYIYFWVRYCIPAKVEPGKIKGVRVTKS